MLGSKIRTEVENIVANPERLDRYVHLTEDENIYFSDAKEGSVYKLLPNPDCTPFDVVMECQEIEYEIILRKSD